MKRELVSVEIHPFFQAVILHPIFCCFYSIYAKIWAVVRCSVTFDSRVLH
jgi:hypothetical protein